MTAAAQEVARRIEQWKLKDFTLTSGTKGWKGALAAISLGTGKVIPASSAAGQLVIGVFHRTVDAAAADKTVTVALFEEITVEWFVNATSTNACASTDIGALAYALDDQTVAITPTGRSPAGRIWAVDSAKGVAIQRIEDAHPVLAQPTAGSYTSNDYAPASVMHHAVYDVPTTAANSTITLPAAAPNGTCVFFAADGTKNGHTVQYRDETGPANLTTALTASKRHLVTCVKRGDKWFAAAYVSP
jgi:hypothetical protein